MTDLSWGPVYAGVCSYCGNQTGDEGSLCARCERAFQGEAPPLDDGPFLLEDEEE